MDSGKAKICRVHGQAGDPGRADVMIQVKRPFVGEFLLVRGAQSLVILGPQLIGWGPPTL